MSRVAPQAGLVLGGQPRVELLPPEVAQNEQARATRRRLIALFVVVLIIVIAGYGAAVFHGQQAQGDLAAAQARTAAIQGERQKYAAVTTTDALITDIDAARTLGASTEIIWSDLLDSIRASLPAGVSITSATMKGTAPWEVPLTPAGPLREPRIATLSIVISSPTIFDATDIVRALVTVPGFADATPDTVTGGSGGYSTTITLNVNDKALSGRFAAKGASK
ncbi:MAG: hypothetical protein V4479_00870 [Actinomycetota bacterium]